MLVADARIGAAVPDKPDSPRRWWRGALGFVTAFGNSRASLEIELGFEGLRGKINIIFKRCCNGKIFLIFTMEIVCSHDGSSSPT